ncbi:MAG: restriction endonuclease subunit S [Synergistaceae bacterium]|nr:restriction endonuclease subunit S [Synergistaceae bacterium]
MSKNIFCPDGVEFKKLGDICEFNRGTSLTSARAVAGEIPVISGGLKPAFYHNISNRPAGCITVAGSGSAGYVSFWEVPIFCADSFTVDPKNTNEILSKYLYYYLTNIQEEIYRRKSPGPIPHIYGKNLADFMIPLPPLEVQREIIRILDKFTELTRELTRELELRKKQYNYYRDKLLTFDNSIKWVTIEELFDIRTGYTPSKRNDSYWENGVVPWFRMDDIRMNGRILSSAMQKISLEAVKNRPFPANSLIISTSATIGEHALITVDFLANQRFTCLTIKKEFESECDIMFAFYYCYELKKLCLQNLNHGHFDSVDMKKFRLFRFPLPPIEEQQRISAILDKFDSLCNSITSGIPAEINARRKQYEYYRDKLLTFKQIDSELTQH